MSRLSKLSPFTVPGLLTLALILSACTIQSNRIGFQGRLTDASGIPLNGTYQIGVQYWTCSSGTSAGCESRYNQAAQAVNVVNGVFDMSIGAETVPTSGGPDPAIYAGPLYAEITVNGETLSPRIPLKGAPYAMSLIGGAVMVSAHTVAEQGTEYATLSVSSVNVGATTLLVSGRTGTGDLIRACSITTIPTTRAQACNDPEFRVTANGNVTADGSFTGGGADVAELVKPVGPVSNYEAGDVLAISPTRDRAVELASEPYSTAVLGVFATRPGMILGGDLLDVHGEDSLLPVAFVGIVPVKVTAENGPIRRGDLLTTSSMAGFAMLADEYVPGAMLGKAMGQLRSGTGVIEVALIVR